MFFFKEKQLCIHWAQINFETLKWPWNEQKCLRKLGLVSLWLFYIPKEKRKKNLLFSSLFSCSPWNISALLQLCITLSYKDYLYSWAFDEELHLLFLKKNKKIKESRHRVLIWTPSSGSPVIISRNPNRLARQNAPFRKLCSFSFCEPPTLKAGLIYVWTPVPCP